MEQGPARTQPEAAVRAPRTRLQEKPALGLRCRAWPPELQKRLFLFFKAASLRYSLWPPSTRTGKESGRREGGGEREGK